MSTQFDQDFRKATVSGMRVLPHGGAMLTTDQELRQEILGVLARHNLPVPVLAVMDDLEETMGLMGRGRVLETRLWRCLEHLRRDGLVHSEPAIPAHVIDPSRSPMGYRITRQGEETLDLTDRVV